MLLNKKKLTQARAHDINAVGMYTDSSATWFQKIIEKLKKNIMHLKENATLQTRTK